MSAVIIIGLVVMWAVVLIPMWLRRHDEHEESRSVDRFTTAMHTLSRREAKQSREVKQTVAAERYGLMPRQVRNVEVHVSGASAPRRAFDRHAFDRRGGEPKAPLTAAQRRRRTLTGLLLVTVVFLVAAVATANLALWTVQILADLAVVAFVVHLRRMAIASAAARRRRPAPRQSPDRHSVVGDSVPPRRAPLPAASYQGYEEATYQDEGYEYEDEQYQLEPRVTVRHYASEQVVARDATFDQAAYDEYVDDYDDSYVEPAAPAAQTAVFDQTTVFEPEPEPVPAEPRKSFIEAGAQPGRRESDPEYVEPQYEQPQYEQPQRREPARRAPEAPAATAGAGSAWEPVPVPRPTYTMKPAAPPRRRRRVEIDEPLLPPVETPVEMDTTDDLEEILDRRWAVND